MERIVTRHEIHVPKDVPVKLTFSETGAYRCLNIDSSLASIRVFVSDFDQITMKPKPGHDNPTLPPWPRTMREYLAGIRGCSGDYVLGRFMSADATARPFLLLDGREAVQLGAVVHAGEALDRIEVCVDALGPIDFDRLHVEAASAAAAGGPEWDQARYIEAMHALWNDHLAEIEGEWAIA